MSTARCGATASNTNTVVESAGIACRRRDSNIAVSVMAPITAARNTLAVGCTTMTKATNASPAEHHGGPRPDQLRRQQDGRAHDRDVGSRDRHQVRHSRRPELAAGSRGDQGGVPEHQCREHRGLIGGHHLVDGRGESTANGVRGPLHRAGAAQLRLACRGEHRDRQVMADAGG